MAILHHPHRRSPIDQTLDSLITQLNSALDELHSQGSRDAEAAIKIKKTGQFVTLEDVVMDLTITVQVSAKPAKTPPANYSHHQPDDSNAPRQITFDNLHYQSADTQNSSPEEDPTS